jgi:hypothetical protein
MSDPTVAELQTRIAELEQEGKTNVRDLMSHKKGFKKLADFLSSKGFDPEADLEEQWNKTVGEKEAGSKEAETKFKKMEAQLAKLEKDNTALAEEKVNNTVKGALTKHMEDVIGGEDLIDLWIATKKVKMIDGKLFRVEGSDEVPLDTSIAAFKKNNPDRIKVKQNGGGGSSRGDEQKPQESQKLKKSEFNKLATTAKKDFLDKGGELTAD